MKLNAEELKKGMRVRLHLIDGTFWKVIFQKKEGRSLIVTDKSGDHHKVALRSLVDLKVLG